MLNFLDNMFNIYWTFNFTTYFVIRKLEVTINY